jgi:hypothetical protein
MPFPLLETPVSARPTVLTVAIRREILSLLAGSDAVTLPSATAQIADGWSARRRRRGDSPSAVGITAAIVFQVGADLVDEVAARRSTKNDA